jgi:HlyD family secretion protein
VLRLDAIQVQANLQIILKQIDELMARQARAEAERDGEPKITFPEDLISRRTKDPVVERLIIGEMRLFITKFKSREGQKAQLQERIGQLKEQIQGLNEQIVAKQQEITLIQQELKGVRELWQKNLVAIARVTALERDAARLIGDRGVLISNIAQAKGRITETELAILQIDQDLRTEVGKDIAEIRGKLSELHERRVAAEDQLNRIDVRAPLDGFVHQLAIHTVGGVISPGEVIMLIVPQRDALTVEAKVPPQDIDQLHLGQYAVIRFSSFNRRTTPELNGAVTFVSADISTDQKTGIGYYTMRIGISAEELSRLGDVKLVPGMPLEAFVKTDDRTVMSYLLKPLHDQIMKAFRER